MSPARDLIEASGQSRERGALRRAVDLAREAVRLATEADDLAQLPEALDTLGAALWSRGEAYPAARVLGAADALRERTGEPPVEPDPVAVLARSSVGWDEGRQLTVDTLLTWLDVGLDRRGHPAAGWLSLTPAERRVAELLAAGKSNPEIAENLYVSTNTVKAQVRRVFSKLGVHHRSEVRAPDWPA
jgi:DNA-binding CsgD family transcriptional regulator